MSQISIVDYLASNNSLSHSRITELFIIQGASAPQLYSATRYDGVLQQWIVSQAGLTLGQQTQYQGILAAGGETTLAPIATDAGLRLLTGGAAGGDLQTRAVLPNGSLGAQTQLSSLPAVFDTFQHSASHQQGGITYVYGSFAAQAGIGRLTFDASGTLTGTAILTDPAVATMAQISASTIVTADGQSFLVTASNLQNGLAARMIGADGGLGAPVVFDADDGLWISAPTVLASAEIGGRSYVILGAAGSDSISVMEIDAAGGMILRDHMMDSRNSRFGGITSLDVVEKDGKTYVIAGGADDGVSVLTLLEGGLLIHRAAFEDTEDISLDNISAIAAHGGLAAAGIDIFVASSSEAGITQLRYDSGPAGVTVTAAPTGGALAGTAGFDILQGLDGDDLISGGAGDDILRDGGGADVLAGGAGADIFVMAADGTADTITDFRPGEDKIDLSLWPLLRDTSQLYISLRSDGMEIRYGDELLIVQSADGGMIDYRMLGTDDLIGASRLTSVIVPGYPGPLTPVLDGIAAPVPQATFNPLMPHSLIAGGSIGDLATGFGRREDGPLLAGSDLGQLMLGTDKADLVIAGGGHDTVDAGAGDDLVFGGEGNDRLIGGNGADKLKGGDGDDRLEGGAGDDLLTGGAGADVFIFNAGHDVVTDFTLGQDKITLDARLWTGLTSVADFFTLYVTTNETGTVIGFDTDDQLTLLDVFDLSALADDVALF